MNISLNIADKQVNLLKEKFGIPDALPTCLRVELWNHTHKSPELSCHISVFTTQNSIEQVQAANFTDAIKLLEAKLEAIPSSVVITDEEVNIECTSSSTTLNTPPKQS